MKFKQRKEKLKKLTWFKFVIPMNDVIASMENKKQRVSNIS